MEEIHNEKEEEKKRYEKIMRIYKEKYWRIKQVKIKKSWNRRSRQ